MRSLADVASVGLVTPYNLFGSKGAVLVALFDRALDELEVRVAHHRARNSIARVLAVAQVTAAMYTADPEYYRPLLRTLLASGEPIHRPFGRSLAIFERSLADAAAAGVLVSGISIELIARQLVVMCTGVLELWMHEEIDDEGCRSQMLYSSMLCLRAVVHQPHAKHLFNRIRAVQKWVPPNLAGSAHLRSVRRPGTAECGRRRHSQPL